MPFINNTDSFVAVKDSFILEKMPDANGTYVKIYLYILACKGRSLEYSEIAQALSVLESDVVNAVKYWQAEGELFLDDDSICFSAQKKNIAPGAKKHKEDLQVSQPEEIPEVKKSDYTGKQVSEAVLASEELREMMKVSEDLLGKPLNPSDMESLYWMYDALGFPPESVLLLLEYCVSKNKPRISYAEKVALSWKERDLVTPEKISVFLRESERRGEEIKRITDKMGISSRPLSSGEEQYFSKWTDEFKMSSEMILLAYEYCIMQTGKISFPYMDKILEGWNNAGIKTTAAAQEEHENFRTKRKTANTVQDDGYSHNDLEQLLRGK